MENLAIHHQETFIVKSIGDIIFKQGQVYVQYFAECHIDDISIDTILDGKAHTQHNKSDITTNMSMYLTNNPTVIASSSSSSTVKVVLQSIDGKIFEIVREKPQTNKR
ncbi:hypothetical protein M9H77_01688 [Catharanthus roseus]|uniref:Uncharacterized protein n=1 Tax=Catharanthus roseus TaxID=4058 RepID=A0ACC0C6A0_CATRO|nr:hypothetical protein M9H77_01688 [Catharanthus roseus]